MPYPKGSISFRIALLNEGDQQIIHQAWDLHNPGDKLPVKDWFVNLCELSLNPPQDPPGDPKETDSGIQDLTNQIQKLTGQIQTLNQQKQDLKDQNDQLTQTVSQLKDRLSQAEKNPHKADPGSQPKLPSNSGSASKHTEGLLPDPFAQRLLMITSKHLGKDAVLILQDMFVTYWNKGPVMFFPIFLNNRQLKQVKESTRNV